MEVLRTSIGPAPRRIDRIVVVSGFTVVIALGEAHRLAGADVDGRQEDHPAASLSAPSSSMQIRAKFSSSRSPAALDFSG